MPAKNATKVYLENCYYHLYNRGVEKRLIFMDPQDYAVFLSYLKEYLLPKNKPELLQRLANPKSSSIDRDKIIKVLRMNNFSDEMTLTAYVLMPNHFHFVFKQKSASAIDKFMNSLATRYTMYFNRKYKRVGSLYQGVYKAVVIENEEQLIYLTTYIHRQAITSSASQGEALQDLYRNPSSCPEYLGLRKTDWVKPEEILSFFSKINPSLSYESFVKQEQDFVIFQNKTLEDLEE